MKALIVKMKANVEGSDGNRIKDFDPIVDFHQNLEQAAIFDFTIRNH